MALRCDLHKVTVLASSKGEGSGRAFGNDQRRLRGFEGTKGNEAIQERWIGNQVKLRARLLLEVGLYIHEGQ